MDVKELNETVSSATSLLKNLEPILKQAEKWSQGQRWAGAIVSLAIAALLLSDTLPTPALTAFVLAIFAISLLTIKRKILEAEIFAIKDKTGKFRAALSSDGENCGLAFFDAKDQPRISFGLTDKGEPQLIFFDPDLKTQAVFGVPQEGGPTLYLYGSDNTPRFQCHILDNYTVISLNSPTGAKVMVAASDTDQNVTVLDNQNHAHARLGSDGENSVLNLISAKDANVSVDLGVYKQTMPGLLINNESGKPAVILSTKDDGSGKLDLHDSNGKFVRRVE